MGVLTALESAGLPRRRAAGRRVGGPLAPQARARANDLVRAVALGSLPLAWALGCLTLAQLFVVARSPAPPRSSSTSPTRATCPRSSSRDQIVDGNAKLQASRVGRAGRRTRRSPAGCCGSCRAPRARSRRTPCRSCSPPRSSRRIRHARPPAGPRATRRPLRVEIAEGLPSSSGTRCCAGSSRAPARQLLHLDLSALLVLYALRSCTSTQSTSAWCSRAGAVGGLLGARDRRAVRPPGRRGPRHPARRPGLRAVPRADPAGRSLGAPVVLLAIELVRLRWASSPTTSPRSASGSGCARRRCSAG